MRREWKTHQANLMRKLNLQNVAEIVLYPVRKGPIVCNSTVDGIYRVDVVY
jgi:hypothetical protein